MRQQITNKAISLLTRREQSQKELQEKLLLKYPDNAELIAKVVAELAAENLQSDLRFCDCFVRYRVSAGYGLQRIKMDLLQKGISSQILQQVLAEQDIDWQEIAAKLYQKKFSDKALDAKGQKKATQYMLRRGFAFADFQGFVRKQAAHE